MSVHCQVELPGCKDLRASRGDLGRSGTPKKGFLAGGPAGRSNDVDGSRFSSRMMDIPFLFHGCPVLFVTSQGAVDTISIPLK